MSLSTRSFIWWLSLWAGGLCLSACGLGASQRLSSQDAPIGVWTLDPKDTVQRNRAKARLDLAQAYYEQGQTAIALQEVAQAQVADPQWIAVYNLKALVLEKMGQSAMAKNSFEEGLRLALRAPSLGSELADLQHNWGLWLCQQGKSAQAMPQFQRAMGQPGYALRNKTELAMSRCDSLAKG
jgi:type IV pilus assembly protein PilF